MFEIAVMKKSTTRISSGVQKPALGRQPRKPATINRRTAAMRIGHPGPMLSSYLGTPVSAKRPLKVAASPFRQ